VIATGWLASPVARADAPGGVLATTPRDQAMKLYAQATKMFEDQDFVAAAVTFGQVQSLLARVDRDASGAVIDKDAHAYRNAALSNKATAYSRANLWVEANNAFVELRDQFGPELSAKDRQEIEDAIARSNERIGTLALDGLPAGELEVRIDGRLERRDVRAPLRMSEGDHSLEIIAKGNRPYVADVAVVGQQQLVQHVALEPLKTPARVRVESTIASSTVTIDGNPLEAPAELALPPGRHHVVVSSESYVTQSTDFDVQPGERTILHVALARTRAPYGLRIAPSYLATFPLRTDTAFGSYAGTLGLALFHDTLRARNLRFGLAFDYTPRTLNSVATGVIGTWCPDRFVTHKTWGDVAWCPASAMIGYVFGGHDGELDTGTLRIRAMTTVEVRRDRGFARLSAGMQGEDYTRNVTDAGGNVQSSFYTLVSSVAEAAVGLDL
jgi:hypothetical protein